MSVPHSRATMSLTVPTENYSHLLAAIEELAAGSSVEVLIGEERRVGARGLFGRRVYSSSSVDLYGAPLHLTHFASDLRSVANHFA